jgi:quercetin dioxygenase-like cupin family protein
MKRLTTFAVAFVLGAGAASAPRLLSSESAAGCGPDLPPGSHERLRATITAAPDLEVIISDVVIPPGAVVPRHYHPGEEFVYAIAGSATHVEEGKPDRVITAGDAMVIPPEAVHAPYAGAEGARAIVFRVHAKGQPERIPVED